MTEKKNVQTTTAEPKSSPCVCCGFVYPADRLIECGGDYYCPDCLDRETVICSHCGTRIIFDDNAGTDDFPLCQNCYDNHYTSCTRCGRIIHQNDAYYDDDNDDAYWLRGKDLNQRPPGYEVFWKNLQGKRPS